MIPDSVLMKTKVLGFLAFIGSMFLSTIFHYPVFTVFWFVAMMFFIYTLIDESSGLAILAYSVIAYIPLGIIYIFQNRLSHEISDSNNLLLISSFALFLVAFLVLEFIIALVWLMRKRYE